jgi:hypothetical protein
VNKELVDAMNELHELAQVEKLVKERRDKARAVVLMHVSAGETIQHGDVTVSVRQGRRTFSADRAADALPTATLQSISRLVPDKDLAREILSDALYEKCCMVSEPSVVVK